MTVEASISLASDSDIRLGGEIRFNGSIPKGVHNPSISINAFQEGKLVWGDTGTFNGIYILGGTSSDWVKNGVQDTLVIARLVEIWWHKGVEQVIILASCGFHVTT